MSGRFCTIITATCCKILYRNPVGVGGRTVRYRTRIRICEYRIIPYCNDTLYRIGYEYEYGAVVVSDLPNVTDLPNVAGCGTGMDIEMDKEMDNEP